MENFAQPQTGFVPQPAATVFPPVQSAPPAAVPQSHSGSKLKLILIAVFVLAVIGGASTGGFLFLKNRSATAQKAENSASANNGNIDRSVAGKTAGPKATPSPASSPSPPPLPANLYENTSFGFSLSGPENWEKAEPGQGILVIFRDPQKSLDANKVEFHSNINVVVDPEAQSFNLDQYKKEGNQQRAIAIGNYVLLGSAKDTLGGEPAYIDDYTGTFGSVTLRQRQVYAIKGGNAYIITFSTLPQDWDKNLLTFDKVRGTFTFAGKVSGAKAQNGLLLGASGGK